MNKPEGRRDFLKTSTASIGLGIGIGFHSSAVAAPFSKSANEKLTVGVMGVNGRGSALAKGFCGQDNVEVTHVCDVDSRAIEKCKASLEGRQAKAPVGVGDFRKILDDGSVDILVCAAPNHWHAPATILGCSAGKHVYVEKPCSHTPWEGEVAIAAARKNKRVVQMGNQRRSNDIHLAAIKKIHEGAIGKALFARCWYNNRRPSIGQGKHVAIPAWLNYELWQGPCTEQKFKSNLLHYNWHWHWHFGNGELGNNGVHAIDVARWGLEVDYPTRVVSAGGRYRFEDDQETADTHMTSFEFGKKMITWEGLSWSPRDTSGSAFGISFHGTEGHITLLDSGYTHYDIRNKVIEENKKGGIDDSKHFANFLSCIREDKTPNSDIEEAHKSTLLCHLGNIAHRTGESLNIDSKNGHIVNKEIHEKYWTKQYRKGWTPKA